jgi:hypothetical protein
MVRGHDRREIGPPTPRLALPRPLLAAILAITGLLIVSSNAIATVPAPAWTVVSARAPTNFAPGESTGADSYLLTITNRGGAPTDGSQIAIVDTLPEGLTLHGGEARASEGLACEPGPPVACTGSPVVAAGGLLTVEVPVDVAPNPPAALVNRVTVSGGGVSPSSTTEETGVSTGSAAFGLQAVDGAFTNADGSPDVQAGSHPYAMNTTMDFTTVLGGEGAPIAAGSPKDVAVKLPPGFVGNPQAVAKCSFQQLRIGISEPEHGCPINSQVGVVTLRESTFFFPNTNEGTFALYNMVPPAGMPAELAFQVAGVPVLVGTSVRTGEDYGLTASLSEASAALPVTGASLTVWGVPAEASHDVQRCPEIDLATGVCDSTIERAREPHSAGTPPVPFLTLPTACGAAQGTTIEARSWQQPDAAPAKAVFSYHDALGSPVPFLGCDRLDFSPGLSLQPDTTFADSPSGLHLDLSEPQNENAEGLAEANLRSVTVVLPQGMSVNPSSATGLEACSQDQIGLHSSSPPSCPDASKIGSVEVRTPLLADPLLGSVYVARQNDNPFGSPLAIYVTAEGDGVLVKLAGQVKADPATGQLTTTFSETPPLPFSAFKAELFGGPRGALATPEGCGTFSAGATLTAWSAPESGADASINDLFAIGSGCVTDFAPTFSAGTTNPRAGAFSPFAMSFSRADSDQELSGLTVALPSGLLAKLAGVPQCSGSDASAGTCPESSRIGSVESGAGPGPSPFFLPGRVYLTGPYKGGSFGLAVVVPAIAGPFDLGTVVVRSSVRIDPSDAHVTAVSDALPRILDVRGANGEVSGFPLRLRRVDVAIDRPEFTLNPTSCAPKIVAGTLSSANGTSASVQSRFQVGDCAALPFKPKFAASTEAHTSKAGGASLRVTVRSGTGQANIGRVRVNLPKLLPSRLTTLQKACVASVFDTNPASCPEASAVGRATADTPLLANPLAGPAYLVSHGNVAFPDLEIVLQGENGIMLILDGKTDIKKGITSSDFATLPDAPISSFELTLPTGPHSALASGLPAKARRSMCGKHLAMPTMIAAQSGAVVKQTTNVSVTGCPKHKAKRKKHKGRARHMRRRTGL